MEYLIQKYLSDNNLSGVSGIDYIVSSEVGYEYISMWNLGISKPEFSSDEIEFGNAKYEKLKQLKRNRINFCENSTVSYNGNTYSNMQSARIAILSRKTSTPENTTSLYFTYPEMLPVTLSKIDYENIESLISDREANARSTELLLKYQIESSITIEELNLINISFS